HASHSDTLNFVLRISAALGYNRALGEPTSTTPMPPVTLVAEQVLYRLRHLTDSLDRRSHEEVLLGAEPAQREAKVQSAPHGVVGRVRTAAVEGLAEVVDGRTGRHLGSDHLAVLGLAVGRPEMAPRDHSGRAILGGEVRQCVEHNYLELLRLRGR